MTIHNDGYLAVSFEVQKGKAPGMQVRLLGEYNGRRDYLVVFKKGDEAFAGLHEFAEQYQVKSASFTGIGAANSIILGWISPDKKRYKNIGPVGQVEVGSLMGNIALYNGRSVVHAHAVVSASDGVTSSGHLFELHVWPTLEVMVSVYPGEVHKTLDPEVGIPLLAPCDGNSSC